MGVMARRQGSRPVAGVWGLLISSAATEYPALSWGWRGKGKVHSHLPNAHLAWDGGRCPLPWMGGCRRWWVWN